MRDLGKAERESKSSLLNACRGAEWCVCIRRWNVERDERVDWRRWGEMKEEMRERVSWVLQMSIPKQVCQGTKTTKTEEMKSRVAAETICSFTVTPQVSSMRKRGRERKWESLIFCRLSSLRLVFKSISMSSFSLSQPNSMLITRRAELSLSHTLSNFTITTHFILIAQWWSLSRLHSSAPSVCNIVYLSFPPS